jgi:hypothetical protein
MRMIAKAMRLKSPSTISHWTRGTKAHVGVGAIAAPWLPALPLMDMLRSSDIPAVAHSVEGYNRYHQACCALVEQYCASSGTQHFQHC